MPTYKSNVICATGSPPTPCTSHYLSDVISYYSPSGLLCSSMLAFLLLLEYARHTFTLGSLLVMLFPQLSTLLTHVSPRLCSMVTFAMRPYLMYCLILQPALSLPACLFPLSCSIFSFSTIFITLTYHVICV